MLDFTDGVEGAILRRSDVVPVVARGTADGTMDRSEGLHGSDEHGSAPAAAATRVSVLADDRLTALPSVPTVP